MLGGRRKERRKSGTVEWEKESKASEAKGKRREGKGSTGGSTRRQEGGGLIFIH